MMDLNDILLAQSIKRWTIVATINEQSLAEHHFNVVMIARCIAAEAGIPDHNIIKYALDHDLDEIMTGDIPSPAKARMGMVDVYAGKSKIRCTYREQLIVKSADLIDAYTFIKANRIGRHGEVVYNHTCQKFEEWMKEMQESDPSIYNAVENTIAIIEFAKYESEVYNERG